LNIDDAALDVTDAAIIIDGMSKTFVSPSRTVDALRDFSLSIDGGQIFGLLGPNGAGKTTLVDILATVLLPTSGTARVLGHDVVRDTAKVRERIGLCVGGAYFFYNLTPREILTYYGKLFDLPASRRTRRIDELFDTFGITAFEHARFSKLSTGMKQKVGIAKSLLNDPEMLFMDEPTTGLDVDVAREVRAHFKRLVEEDGKTILLTSHQLFEVEELCSTIAVINDGRKVVEGSIDDIRRELGFPDAIRLIVDGDVDLDVLRSLSAVTAVDRDGDEVVIRSTCAFDTVMDLAGLVREKRLPVVDMEVRKSSLEEMFTSLVRGDGTG
jgi:ABC-2 type transport system ATP-binding protein